MVVCLSDYPAELVQDWVSGAAEVVVADRSAGLQAVSAELARAQVVIADAARRLVLDAAHLRRLKDCRLIIVPAVGVDGALDVAEAHGLGIPVVNAPGYNADAVADWTVWAMLQALREPLDLREAGWEAGALGRELGAVRVGLLGYGAIGRAVARRLAGFGTTVVHHTSRRRDEPGWVELTELFAGCDIVSLHAPLTPATRGLVDARLLASMPDGGVLVNAARGGLVVEQDLVTALRAGRPARAVLDVFDTEPLPADSPLRELANVFLTPHVAAGTVQARQRVRAIVRSLLRQALGFAD